MVGAPVELVAHPLAHPRLSRAAAGPVDHVVEIGDPGAALGAAVGGGERLAGAQVRRPCRRRARHRAGWRSNRRSSPPDARRGRHNRRSAGAGPRSPAQAAVALDQDPGEVAESRRRARPAAERARRRRCSHIRCRSWFPRRGWRRRSPAASRNRSGRRRKGRRGNRRPRPRAGPSSRAAWLRSPRARPAPPAPRSPARTASDRRSHPSRRGAG